MAKMDLSVERLRSVRLGSSARAWFDRGADEERNFHCSSGLLAKTSTGRGAWPFAWLVEAAASRLGRLFSSETMEARAEARLRVEGGADSDVSDIVSCGRRETGEENAPGEDWAAAATLAV
ncbi:BQ5605_C012g06992 [Microbotryum silenes-dioicae]|uniref:BQ5605_C012g06992 protein n=1 Tax=Microbotryum silenes-dioicae TaxID=796604 RepID=A0A2X0LX32_9BASI|nr:BQ5605_C012g06992 [Microbotryum silenes-dioicae]